MRQGFSLLELVLVLAVVGLLLGIALPQLSGALDRIEVDSVAHQISGAHQRARLLALARGTVVVLSVSPQQLVIRLSGEAATVWSQPGPSASGVALQGADRQFTFSPVGMTLGLSNATIHLTRGSAARSVIVSRLGRIRIEQ
jgi:prepilin-type N-terminal cleavage/methylation domain-containing protein